MRILVLADVHANPVALEAIREPHDLCVVVGDLVDYGPEPGACVDWARANAAHAVRGNHDHGAAQNVDAFGTTGFRYLTAVTRPLTVAALTPPQRRYLSDLPTTTMFAAGGQKVLLVHATPRDPMDEYAPPDAARWTDRLAGVDADVVCVGHTHHAYALTVGKTTVVNPGSVGLPRDGDPRAAYAVIEDGRVELKRVEYPVERTVEMVNATDLPAEAKRMLAQVYRTGRLPPAPVNGNGSENGRPTV